MGKTLKSRVGLSYLDVGSGVLTLKVAQSHDLQKLSEIALTNTGHWKKFTVEQDVYFHENSGSFILLDTSAPVYLHEILIDPVR